MPYHAVLLSSFSATSQLLDTDEKFHKFDEINVVFKLATRFGALVLSSTAAAAVCYPFDTIKRRIQVEGAPGYANSGVLNEWAYANKMVTEEGWRSLYRGFGLGMMIRAPMSII